MLRRVWLPGLDRVAGPNPSPAGQRPFAYYAKMGVGIARGGSAEIDVPPPWRSRVRVTWGDVASAVQIRFRRCDSGSRWVAYAGGFLFRRRTGGCVPLRITVGARTRVVRFGAGRPC